MKLIGNFLLLVIALVLFPILFIPNFVLVLINKGCASGYFRSTAVAIDRFASGEYRTLWNTIFIKKHIGYKFNGDYTISYYLGKNQHFGTLSDFGEYFVFFLDLLDKNHCEKAYKAQEGKI